MDLKNGKLEWLSRHLGHDLNTHKDFYKLHEGFVELTNIRRLLLAADQGAMSKLRGKKLKDITIEGMCFKVAYSFIFCNFLLIHV